MKYLIVHTGDFGNTFYRHDEDLTQAQINIIEGIQWQVYELAE